MTADRTPRPVPELPPGYRISPRVRDVYCGETIIDREDLYEGPTGEDIAWAHYGRALHATGDVREQMIRAAEASLRECDFEDGFGGEGVMVSATRIVDGLLAADEKGEGRSAQDTPDIDPGNGAKRRKSQLALESSPAPPSPDHAAQIAAAEREVIEEAERVIAECYAGAGDYLEPLNRAVAVLRRLREEVGG